MVGVKKVKGYKKLNEKWELIQITQKTPTHFTKRNAITISLALHIHRRKMNNETTWILILHGLHQLHPRLQIWQIGGTLGHKNTFSVCRIMLLFGKVALVRIPLIPPICS